MPPRSRRTKLVERRRQRGAASEDNADDNKKGGVFHFVNVNPSSETQKSENRSVIRSHASKYIWRQHRAVRADGTTGAKPSPIPANRSNSRVASVSAEPSAVGSAGQPSGQADIMMVPFSEYSSQDQDWEAVPWPTSAEEAAVATATATANTTPSLPLAAECQSYDEELVSSKDKDTETSEPAPGYTSGDLVYVSPDNGPMGSNPNTIATPFNQLMKWIEDPSSTESLAEPSKNKLMRYAAYDLWPGLVLGAGGQEWNRDGAPNAWLPRAFQNKALFTAFMYGAAGHMQTRKRLEGAAPLPQTIEERNEQIICANSTVELLNKVVTDPVESGTDEAILAVLCMAFNRTDWRSWSGTDPFPKPPLRNLQWLDVYGGLSMNDSHVNGLMLLLGRRGGVYQLKLPGLAETLSVASIMLSTKNLMPSQLPYVPIFKGSAKGQTPGWPSLGQSMGVGMFEGGSVDPLPKAKLPDALVKAIQDMRDYNAVVNLYCQGLLSKLSLAAIADRRNYVQFNLLALKAGHCFPRQFTEAYPTYEPCRLGAMVYSILIIFPLPATNRPFSRLAGYLKVALLDSGTTTVWEGASEMLLWVLVMGCIASRGTLYEEWFYKRLRDTVISAGLSAWPQLKHILITVIWLDSTCDMRGQAVWDEVSKRFTPEQVADLYSEPAFLVS